MGSEYAGAQGITVTAMAFWSPCPKCGARTTVVSQEEIPALWGCAKCGWRGPRALLVAKHPDKETQQAIERLFLAMGELDKLHVVMDVPGD